MVRQDRAIPKPTPNSVKDKTGIKHGNITVLGFSRIVKRDSGKGTTYWLAECKCGNRFEISSCNIKRSKNCRDCGIRSTIKARREQAVREMNDKMFGMYKTTGGTRAYDVWSRMKNEGRLNRKWHDFKTFVCDIGVPVNYTINLQYPSDELLDKSNSCWAIGYHSRIVLKDNAGISHTLGQIAKKLGVTRSRVHQKYQKAIEKGVDPLEYIQAKQIKGGPEKKTIDRYEKCLDGEVHVLQFDDNDSAEYFRAGIYSYVKRHRAGCRIAFRILDNYVICKLRKGA